MKWGLIVGLYVFQVSLFSVESDKEVDSSKTVQVSQEAQEEEEELVVFEESDFTENEFSE